jgi:hypothetical protein
LISSFKISKHSNSKSAKAYKSLGKECIKYSDKK